MPRPYNSPRSHHSPSYPSLSSMSYGGSASSMMIDADSDDDAPQSARQKNMKTRGKKVDAAASAMRAAIMKTQLQDHSPAALQIRLTHVNNLMADAAVSSHMSSIDQSKALRLKAAAEGGRNKRKMSLMGGLGLEDESGYASGRSVGRMLSTQGGFGGMQSSLTSSSVSPMENGGEVSSSGKSDASFVNPSDPNRLSSTFVPVSSRKPRRSTIDRFKEELQSYKRVKKSPCMIPIMHPAAPGRMKWDLVLAVILVWNLIEIPFQVCFDVEADCLTGYDLFGFSLDIFFICDVVVNFHTGYIDDGHYVEDAGAVSWHYFKHGFPLDGITSIPYARVLNIAAGSFCSPPIEIAADGSGEEVGGNLALLPKLLRIFRIFKLVKLFRLVKLMNVISTWEGEAGVGFSRVLRMFMLFFYVVFLSHIAGCLFAMTALSEKKNNDGEWMEESWVARYASATGDEDALTSKFRLYVLSFYWAITTLTTVGYGDLLPFTNDEIMLAVVVQFVGTMVFAYIMASITSVVSSEDVTAMLIKQKISELNEYMTHRDLSPELKLRIRSHYEYQWKRTTIYDEEQILESLPPFLRMDVACSMNLDLVKNVPVLAALGDDCMAMLVTKLKPLQLVPGEQVVRKGTVGHEMYFITEGILDVYMDETDEVPKCSLTQGSYFGEPAILSSKPVKRGATLQARMFSQLESLSKMDFLAVSELFPDILKMLNEVAALTGEEEEFTEEEEEVHTTCENTKLIMKSLGVILARLEDLEHKGTTGRGGRRGSALAEAHMTEPHMAPVGEEGTEEEDEIDVLHRRSLKVQKQMLKASGDIDEEEKEEEDANNGGVTARERQTLARRHTEVVGDVPQEEAQS